MKNHATKPRPEVLRAIETYVTNRKRTLREELEYHPVPPAPPIYVTSDSQGVRVVCTGTFSCECKRCQDCER